MLPVPPTSLLKLLEMSAFLDVVFKRAAFCAQNLSRFAGKTPFLHLPNRFFFSPRNGAFRSFELGFIWRGKRRNSHVLSGVNGKFPSQLGGRKIRKKLKNQMEMLCPLGSCVRHKGDFGGRDGEMLTRRSLLGKSQYIELAGQGFCAKS